MEQTLFLFQEKKEALCVCGIVNVAFRILRGSLCGSEKQLENHCLSLSLEDLGFSPCARVHLNMGVT